MELHGCNGYGEQDVQNEIWAKVMPNFSISFRKPEFLPSRLHFFTNNADYADTTDGLWCDV
jgi:hypothetical protein